MKLYNMLFLSWDSVAFEYDHEDRTYDIRVSGDFSPHGDHIINRMTITRHGEPYSLGGNIDQLLKNEAQKRIIKSHADSADNQPDPSLDGLRPMSARVIDMLASIDSNSDYDEIRKAVRRAIAQIAMMDGQITTRDREIEDTRDFIKGVQGNLGRFLEGRS